jgi:hypothetical protein
MLRNITWFAMGAIVALVLGTGTAYAATGGTFKLGRGNAAAKTTTLTNAYGTALQLNSKAGQPPLRVNRNTKVPYLNSDLLDGRDSTGFAYSNTRIATITRTGRLYSSVGGTEPDQIIAIATCPAGSQLTGGGGLDGTADGDLYWNAPGDGNSWMVASSTTDLTPDNAVNVEASARCWNPRANVADSYAVTPPARSLSPATRATLARAAGK